MNNGLSIRVTAFALAAAITLSLMAGLDALANDQHAGGLISQTCEPGQIAAVPTITNPAALGS
jgi:hypothetical protein